jgi:hypothetical protein
MRRLVLLPVLLALALVPSASAGLPNACTLLTNAEVAKVFGAKIQNRTRDGNRLFGGCTWNGVPPSSFTSYHATLRTDIAHLTRAQFDKAAKRAKNAVPVHGVGDAAFSEYVDSGSTYLSVWAHGIWISIDLSTGSVWLAAAKTLARAALARL